MIPFNYCAVCRNSPDSVTFPEYCNKCNPYTTSPIYCTNCGIVLNRLLNEPKPRERILCSGCYHAFLYPRQEIKINEKTMPFLAHQLATYQPLPIHVKQAYERQYRLLASPR